MLKVSLRREMLQKRIRYTAAEVAVLSQQICARFFESFSLKVIRSVHVFLPIQRKNEVDTWYIIRKLQNDYPHVKIAVPVTHMQELTLSHYLLTPTTVLRENNWGIQEPAGAEIILPREIDVVLVPLLAFDNQGHRVGYGKGFYDGFLRQCRPDTLKIGLSLETAVHQISDVHEGDVVLDYAVTPGQVYCFS